jgi:hypothetical protein
MISTSTPDPALAKDPPPGTPLPVVCRGGGTQPKVIMTSSEHQPDPDNILATAIFAAAAEQIATRAEVAEQARWHAWHDTDDEVGECLGPAVW